MPPQKPCFTCRVPDQNNGKCRLDETMCVDIDEWEKQYKTELCHTCEQKIWNTVINILKEQMIVFESEYDDPDNPNTKPYLDGKINGLRIGIMEVEARCCNGGKK